MKVVDGARDYLQEGLQPTPIRPDKKEPALEGWPSFHCTEADLEGLFGGDGVGVGLVLGERSRWLTDVDLDTSEAVEAGRVFLPATALKHGRASRRNSHWWYICPGSKTTKFFDLDGRKTIAELRSTGAQTVVPPSRHPSGEQIEWEEQGEPAHVSFPELHRCVGLVASAALLARVWPRTQGARHAIALGLAGFLLRRGIDVEQLGRVIEVGARVAGDEELKDRVDAVRSTWEAFESGKPVTGYPALTEVLEERVVAGLCDRLVKWLGGAEGQTSFEPFPALPGPLEGFVSTSSKVIGCDRSFVALPLLAGLGAAVGNSCVIQLKRGWVEPPILWVVIIGESGTLKSPALDLALRPVRRRQAEAFDEYKAALEEYGNEMVHYERALKDWRRDGGGEPPEKPIRPVPRRHIVSDTTLESLAVILSENPALLLARDELQGWLGSFDQYKRGRSDAAAWLEMHRGGHLLVDRKSQETISVPRAAVSIAGGVQPRTLARALGEQHYENGLVARLLMTMPPRPLRRWTEDEVDQAERGQVALVFEQLWALEPDVDDHGRESPRKVRLSAAAKAEWVAFYERHAREQRQLTGRLASAYSKLEGYCARLALILHLVENSGEEVGPESVRRAVGLVEWLKRETRRVYSELSRTDESLEEEEFISWIREQGGAVTVREVVRGRRRFRGDSKAAEEALEDLVRKRHGEWQEVPPGSQGGRPTTVFRLREDSRVDETYVDETPGAPVSD